MLGSPIVQHRLKRHARARQVMKQVYSELPRRLRR